MGEFSKLVIENCPEEVTWMAEPSVDVVPVVAFVKRRKTDAAALLFRCRRLWGAVVPIPTSPPVVIRTTSELFVIKRSALLSVVPSVPAAPKALPPCAQPVESTSTVPVALGRVQVRVAVRSALVSVPVKEAAPVEAGVIAILSSVAVLLWKVEVPVEVNPPLRLALPETVSPVKVGELATPKVTLRVAETATVALLPAT